MLFFGCVGFIFKAVVEIFGQPLIKVFANFR
ncbi:hypothetical protein ACLKMH_20865 [Psychromonas sp. KJ10-10]